MQLSKRQLLLLSLGLATFALWLDIWLESSQSEQDAPTQLLSEQAIWQFTDTQLWRPQITQVDTPQTSSESNFYLHANKVTYEKQKNTQIEQLNLVTYLDNQFNIISSDRAQIAIDRTILLQQQHSPVLLQHWRAENQNWQQEIQLSGKQFTYNEQQQTLRSDKPVTLSQSGATIYAGSLQADLENGNWNLRNGIQGTFLLPK